MGALDTALLNLGNTLLSAFSSETATLVIDYPATYDPRAGEELAVPSETFSIHLSPAEQYELREVDGDRVQAGDLRTYCSPVELTKLPQPMRARLFWRGFEYRVVTVTPTGTADTDVLYMLQLRR